MSDEIVDSIVSKINEWRAELQDNIDPLFTDNDVPVRDLPPLEGRDLEMIKVEIRTKLKYGWPVSCIVKWMKYSEEVCPFWTEDHAMKRMKEASDNAKLQGAR